jgi:hypothetical protein
VKEGREWRGEIVGSDPAVALLMKETGVKSPFRMAPGWKDEKGIVPPIDEKEWEKVHPIARCQLPADPKHPEIPECLYNRP